MLRSTTCELHDENNGYLAARDSPGQTRWLSARFDSDYVAGFDHVDRINGHLLVSTVSRFKLDARFQHLGESPPTTGRDELWLGDCNLAFRFVQSERGQFRAGVGLNWLTDKKQTDLGFNFMYGADFFPARPWVVSAVMDAGTIGNARLFRFRTTAGVVYHRVEAYTGYEYTALGHSHWNGLIGGVRLWF